MRSITATVGLLVALGGGYFAYQTYLTKANVTKAPPQEQIDVIDITSNLIVIGQAERQYVAMHGTYGTLEQLLQDNLVTGGAELRGYLFTIAVDGSRAFTATATPTDANKAGWPTLTIDETMQVKQH